MKSVRPAVLNLFSTMAVALLFSCSPPTPELPGFDALAWKEDRNGCAGRRQALGDLILDNKDLLLAQPESGIIDVLGRPDKVELYKRNQKLFHYYLRGAAPCNTSDTTQTGLSIRFNAMGRAKEILIN